MSDITDFFAGQDAGTKCVDDLYYSGDWAGGRPDKANRDRLINLEILETPTLPLVQADQKLAGIEYSTFFSYGWHAGFRAKFLILVGSDPKFARRYQYLSGLRQKRELARIRAERQAKEAAQQERDAALIGGAN